MTSLKETVAEKGEVGVHQDYLVAEKEFLLVENAQLESRLEAIPRPETMVEGYKKSEDLVDSTLDMMKSEIATHLKVVVDNIKAVNPEFPLVKVGLSKTSWRTLMAVLLILVSLYVRHDIYIYVYIYILYSLFCIL